MSASTARKNTKATNAPATVAPAAPATTVAATPAAATVVAPVVAQWVPQPKYGKTIAKATNIPAVLPNHVLLAVTGTANRGGTAKAAALAALQANIGNAYPIVLAAVAQSEKSWHMAHGRTPRNLSPVGWFKSLGATFGAPVVAG